MPDKTIAIACQGGGSHCAFGAGVLISLLRNTDSQGRLQLGGERYRIGGFSGTSGGAINALLAWYGLVHPDGPAVGADALQSFWHDSAAGEWWDYLANTAMVMAVRLRGVLPQLEAAPNVLSDLAHDQLRRQIEAQVNFARLSAWIKPDSPRLLIGAADVLSGEFVVFGRDRCPCVPQVREVLASTAVPELFRPVEIEQDGRRRFFWDGLLSQNPPVRDFMSEVPAAQTPDEIWVIRINPVSYADVPAHLHDIIDRRNEMAGNISLEQERFFVEHVNQWVERGLLPRERYKHVGFREIAMEEKSRPGDGLDYASKLDRRPQFIARLMARGIEAGAAFLSGKAAGAPASRPQAMH